MTLTPVYQASSQYPEPLIVFLHGRGEIGGDSEQRVRTFGPWLNAGYNPRDAYRAETLARIARFHVLGLHLSEGDWDGAALGRAVDRHLAEHPTIDKTRLYLTGFSLGGRGVLRLALQRKRTGQHVSAIASFCPAGDPDAYSEEEIGLLRSVPIYLFHCPEDEVVPFEGSARLHRRLGSDVSRLRIVHRSELADPRFPHDCWTQFYGTPGLYEWFSARAADPAGWPHLDPTGYAANPA